MLCMYTFKDLLILLRIKNPYLSVNIKGYIKAEKFFLNIRPNFSLYCELKAATKIKMIHYIVGRTIRMSFACCDV